MNIENTMRLVERFPKFFCPKKKPKDSLMCFGFECQDGWYTLIYKLCLDLETMLKKLKKLASEYGDFEVSQVKEKFGGLRFYVNWATDEMYDRIHQAETESLTICEVCGLPGKPNGRGWITTLCEECRGKKKQ